MHTINMNTTELKHIIEKKLQHPYVEKFVKKPFIDEDKLMILNYIYQDIQIPASIKQQHMLTIMLVQIALDTHEKIPNQNQDDNMQETEKQLAVLAGDYYSGLYYLLLSEMEEVNMIQVLASAIRQINEYKMCLFYEEAQSTSELFDIVGEIESKLFTEVAIYLGVDRQIVDIIHLVILLNCLKREQAVNGIIANYIRKKKHHTAIGEDVTLQLNEMYRNMKEQLEDRLIQLPYQHLQFSNTIRNTFTLSSPTSVAEEG